METLSPVLIDGKISYLHTTFIHVAYRQNLFKLQRIMRGVNKLANIKDNDYEKIIDIHPLGYFAFTICDNRIRTI